ncbi:AIPR family protein [Lysinibacillus fusiformis]|uniref:AIPR family protein n=1 Tax=Lysinibacillus fusiformis TaxID=28031 RepID=UPI00088C63EB|nr:AIPR family protein [Lysinibacillus fusiformis]SCX63458.1 AIPR protein [Lysinibacillus fusiformis]SDB46296.1 AIPR protein [Lysinibacillus fusiformis]SFI73199.1 AIPR protein [Lysinibacillus fusiformis]SFT15828.1 AIPR protein [Lysinibacillus fusiformis]
MTMIKVKATQFKKMEDPIGRASKRKYVCYVHIDDLPEDISFGPNPRDQRLTTAVAKEIEESLLSNDGDFHLKNRGVVISAKKVTYDTKSNEMALFLDDDYEHGNIDGGHSLKIALKHKDKGLDQYMTFEVMVGVEDIIEPLAAARNTSVQVDEKSLAELSNKFEPIKDAIGGMPFFERIAFKQNQQLAPRVKMIDAREIVAIISMFDCNNYTETIHPTKAYSSKAKILEDYLKDPDAYIAFSNIATDIFDLYDQIEIDFPEAYNSSNGRYGAKKYSGYKEGNVVAKSKFRQEEMIYKVPDGLIYPLVAAFRANVELNATTGKYEWKRDVFDVYDEIREQMASKIMKYTDAVGNNPNAVGKDVNAWDILYMTVERVV